MGIKVEGKTFLGRGLGFLLTGSLGHATRLVIFTFSIGSDQRKVSVLGCNVYVLSYLLSLFK